MADLRLSNAVLGQLARPGFSRNAGLAIGAGMLGVERREREEEQRLVQESSLELMQKAQIAQEAGDMGMLTGAANDLNELLGATKNAESRQLILDSINTVNQQRGATQSNKTTNTAMSILNTEKALQNFDQQMGPLSDQELLVQKTLQERLAMMKRNTAAATEASTIQYNTELTALTREEQLRDERGKAVIAALSSVKKGSERYSQVVKQANTLNLGKFVKDFERTELELEKLDGEVAKIKDEDPRKPLTAEQKKRLAATGYKSSGDPALDRKQFISLVEGEAKAARGIALRNITEVSGGEARALARQALRDIQTEPGADLSLNILDDLSEEIDELSDEELQELYDLSEGKTPVEIRQIAVDWTRNKFSDEFEDMLQVQENESRELDEAATAIDAVIAATNAKSGAKPWDTDYKDPNDPLVRGSALERLKSDASKQRGLTQAQGVGGRVL
jgi:hypothetical protein